ncbi:MAG TPA: DUF2721 domain-containing protein [Ohtaekwangia sp.]|uniref:DUF2721 domain-containing protein n=1 Tax=Ohtaekwangia sp. TaxID=2066019 RepID=UPI002F92BD74
MQELSTVLTVLSAMITPAVLILASGSLLLTTSQRLNRAIDRARSISDIMINPKVMDTYSEERRELLSRQIVSATRRAWLLQRAISAICFALAMFVATSMSIGIIELTHSNYIWIPAALGMTGIGILFYSTILFILETRIAYHSVQREMNFIQRQRSEVADISIIDE